MEGTGAGSGVGRTFVPREDLVQALINLGVSRNAALKALYYTGNYNADLAAAWLFENQDKNLDNDFVEGLDMSEGSSEDEDEDDVEEYLGDAFKMVFIVNSELNMGVGKVASQVGHAACGLYRQLVQEEGVFGDQVLRWEHLGEAKIVLKGTSTLQLSDLAAKATQLGLPHYSVADAGKTQVAPGSVTVLSIFGKVEEVNKVTGSLSLL